MLGACGYNLIEADSGTKAVMLVNKFAEVIHLIITDTVMPGLNGPKRPKKSKYLVRRSR